MYAEKFCLSKPVIVLIKITVTFVDLSEFNNSVSSKEDSFTGSSQTSAPRTNGGVPPPLPQRPQSRTTGSLPQVNLYSKTCLKPLTKR